MTVVEEESNPFLAYVALGTFTFTIVNIISKYFLVPQSANNSKKQSWKWCNIFTSFVHSSITGVWAPTAFYFYPSMCNDLITEFNFSIHILVSFSIGYFVYDFIDMLLFNMKKSTIELLIHHTCVIVCFGIAASSRVYLPYATVALIVEINSVFLHLRQLCIIQGLSKQTMLYRNIALLNVATFVLFRILLLGWMTRWLTVNRDIIPVSLFTCGSIGLATIIALNTMLFYKILNSDFFCSSGSSHSQKLRGEMSNNLVGENGFHPVSKDVNRIMKTFFDDDNSQEISSATKSKLD